VHFNIIRQSTLGYGKWNKQCLMLEMDFSACDDLIDPGKSWIKSVLYDKLQNYGREAGRLKQKGPIVNMCPVCCYFVLLTTCSFCYSQGSKLQQV
jgi:hypothetical protein